MSFSVLRCYEYAAKCDRCGVMDVAHTGDSHTVNGETILVHDTQSAIKYLIFHRTKYGFICDDCYRQVTGRK